MERNLVFEVSLEFGPVSGTEIRAIRWVLKGWATRSFNEYRKVVWAQRGARSQIHPGCEILGYHDVQDIRNSQGVVCVSGWGVRSKDQTGVPASIIKLAFPPVALSREFQSTSFALMSAAIKTGINPPKQADWSAPISERESERYAVRIFTGLLANLTWMAVAFKLVSPGKGTEWWTIRRRARMAVPRPAVCLSVWWHT